MTLQAAKTLQYKIETRQCTDCASENSSGGGEPWRAVVQLRQHVDHKRTLLALEQKSLDRKMLESCLGEWCGVYMYIFMRVVTLLRLYRLPPTSL